MALGKAFTCIYLENYFKYEYTIKCTLDLALDSEIVSVTNDCAPSLSPQFVTFPSIFCTRSRMFAFVLVVLCVI